MKGIFAASLLVTVALVAGGPVLNAQRPNRGRPPDRVERPAHKAPQVDRGARWERPARSPEVRPLTPRRTTIEPGRAPRTPERAPRARPVEPRRRYERGNLRREFNDRTARGPRKGDLTRKFNDAAAPPQKPKGDPPPTPAPTPPKFTGPK